MIPEVGDTVEVTGLMLNDPDPIPVGTFGTVRGTNQISGYPTQIYVDWETSRSLILLSNDPFRIVKTAEE